MADTTMHLTNVAIQKKSETYDSETGGKWMFRDLKLYLMSRYGSTMVDRLFNEIQSVMMRSLFSVQNVMMNDKHCFELYGFDIMFDDSFKVYVLEVNASPSMSANTKEDQDFKVELLSSAFDIVDMENNMKGDEVRVGGFDLAYRGVAYNPSPSSQYTTYLGCDIPKEHILRAKGGGNNNTTSSSGANTGSSSNNKDKESSSLGNMQSSNSNNSNSGDGNGVSMSTSSGNTTSAPGSGNAANSNRGRSQSTNN